MYYYKNKRFHLVCESDLSAILQKKGETNGFTLAVYGCLLSLINTTVVLINK